MLGFNVVTNHCKKQEEWLLFVELVLGVSICTWKLCNKNLYTGMNIFRLIAVFFYSLIFFFLLCIHLFLGGSYDI